MLSRFNVIFHLIFRRECGLGRGRDVCIGKRFMHTISLVRCRSRFSYVPDVHAAAALRVAIAVCFVFMWRDWFACLTFTWPILSCLTVFLYLLRMKTVFMEIKQSQEENRLCESTMMMMMGSKRKEKKNKRTANGKQQERITTILCMCYYVFQYLNVTAIVMVYK